VQARLAGVEQARVARRQAGLRERARGVDAGLPAARLEVYRAIVARRTPTAA